MYRGAERDLEMLAFKTGVMRSKTKERWQSPKLEDTRNRFPSKALRETVVLLTP